MPVTRAALTRADVAAIQVRLVDDPSKTQTLLFAASDNGGYVTFSSALRQNFTLRGSWITGTRGIGWDLLSAASSQPDPLVTAIPPGSWPQQVERTYEFTAFAPQGRIATFTCTYEFGEQQEIVIVEDRHVGVVVSETCAGEFGVVREPAPCRRPHGLRVAQPAVAGAAAGAGGAADGGALHRAARLIPRSHVGTAPNLLI